MAEKKFSGAPFGTQTARFDVTGVHPNKKIPGTFTQIPYDKPSTMELNQQSISPHLTPSENLKKKDINFRSTKEPLAVAEKSEQDIPSLNKERFENLSRNAYMILNHSTSNSSSSRCCGFSSKYDQTLNLKSSVFYNILAKWIIKSKCIMGNQIQNSLSKAKIGTRKVTKSDLRIYCQRDERMQASNKCIKNTPVLCSLRRKMSLTNFMAVAKRKKSKNRNGFPGIDHTELSALNNVNLQRRAMLLDQFSEKKKIFEVEPINASQNRNFSNNSLNDEPNQTNPEEPQSEENLLDTSTDQVDVMDPAVDKELGGDVGFREVGNGHPPGPLHISMHDCRSASNQIISSTVRKSEEKIEKASPRKLSQNAVIDLSFLSKTPARAMSLETSRANIKMLISWHTSTSCPKGSSVTPKIKVPKHSGSKEKNFEPVNNAESLKTKMALGINELAISPSILSGSSMTKVAGDSSVTKVAGDSSMTKVAGEMSRPTPTSPRSSGLSSSKTAVETNELAPASSVEKWGKVPDSGSEEKVAGSTDNRQTVRQRHEGAVSESCQSLLRRKLGPGAYNTMVGGFSTKSVENKASGPGWARQLEVERLAALPHLLYKEQWEENRMLKRKLGPGSYDIKDFIQMSNEKPRSGRGICDKLAPRFEKGHQSATPGPGTYGIGGVPQRALEDKDAQSTSTKGMLDKGDRKRTLPSVGSHLGPGTYRHNTCTDELLNKVTSLKGPYKLYSGDRNKPISEGYLAAPQLADLGPGQYEIGTFVDELHSKERSSHGKFGKMAQYPEVPTDRLFLFSQAHCNRRNIPGPGAYSVQELSKPTAVNSPGFLSSAKRDDKVSQKFFTRNFNPVGAGRYDVQKFDEAQDVNGHSSVFKSRTGKPNLQMAKFLQERIRAKDVSVENRVVLSQPTKMTRSITCM